MAWRVHRPYATNHSRWVAGMRVITARSIAVIPGATAKPSLRVPMTLDPMAVSHHRARSRLVSVFSAGRPLEVTPGVWSGRESMSCCRITTDITEPGALGAGEHTETRQVERPGLGQCPGQPQLRGPGYRRWVRRGEGLQVHAGHLLPQFP